jgi:hypothetical protein
MDCNSCSRRKGSAACDECGWWGNYRPAQNIQALPKPVRDDRVPLVKTITV